MDENTNAVSFDSGIIVTCVDDKYIGYLLGVDENYLYIKYTHKMKEVYPTPTEETIAKVAEIIDARPVWLMRLQVAKRFGVNPMKFEKSRLVRILAEELVDDVIKEDGKVETYVAQPHAIKIALAHGDVVSFASLSDATTSAILTGLDFQIGSEYNEKHDEPEQR